MKFVPINWQQFEKHAIVLAKKIRDEYGTVDEIVAISRGGIVAARILSDILDTKISFITISSYENFNQSKNLQITQPTPRKFNGEKILLLDELADSGKTFLTALSYLEKLPIKKIITASLYIKPKTKYIPHFYVKKIDGWIILPYELRETKASLVEKLGLQEAKKTLKKLSIIDWSDIA